MATTITPHEDTPSRKRKITKFALAGVAVLGVGAALTSAAWSDNVFFAGTSSTGSLDLQGRGTAGQGGWQQGDDANVPIVIPASALTNVGPGVTDTHTVEVRNNGTVDVWLDSIVVEGTGPLFVAGATADLGAVVDTGTDRVLAPGDNATIEVLVTGDVNWVNGDGENLGGVVTVAVHGTSDSPPAP
jgi:hypothetical protein